MERPCSGAHGDQQGPPPAFSPQPARRSPVSVLQKRANLMFIQDQLGEVKPAPVLRCTCLLDKGGICCHAVNMVTVCIYRARTAHWPPVFCQTNEGLITPPERNSETMETHSRTELCVGKFPLESNLNSRSGSVPGAPSLREVVVIPSLCSKTLVGLCPSNTK